MFGARAGKAAAEYASLGLEVNPARDRAEDRRTSPARARPAEQEGDANASPTCATRCRSRWSRAPASTATAHRSGRGWTRSAGCRSATPTWRSRTTAGRSTPNGSPRSSSRACSTSPSRSSRRPRAGKSRAARTSAPTFPKRDDVRFLAHSLIYRNADGSARVEYLPVTITRWPPAERVYGEEAPHGGPNHVAGRALSSGAGV